jgi:hypothetical protein
MARPYKDMSVGTRNGASDFGKSVGRHSWRPLYTFLL